MNARYRPPRSGKRSLAIAVIAPVVLAAGVYVALDKPSIPVPVVVEPPDNAQRHTRSEPLYRPTPLPKAALLRLSSLPNLSLRDRWGPASSSARKPTAR